MQKINWKKKDGRDGRFYIKTKDADEKKMEI